MTNLQPPLAHTELFDNTAPEEVWKEAVMIVRRINPGYDFTLVQKVYTDVLRVFYGEFPGYSPIRTLYHDLAHTLDVFMCGIRLMHGVHVSGDPLKDDEITLIMLSMLMHDIGYAQRKGEETGTGAQFTHTHVQRGVEFMTHYFHERDLSPDVLAEVSVIMLGTEHLRPFAQINFKNDRSRMLGQIVATADIIGQMADRKYLEKLLFLYQEFNEAKLGDYRSMYDLICQTNRFYEMTREKLDGALGGVYKKLEFHFKDTLGADSNFYMASIEKNLAYLAQVVACGETDFINLLKRNGIAESSRTVAKMI